MTIFRSESSSRTHFVGGSVCLYVCLYVCLVCMSVCNTLAPIPFSFLPPKPLSLPPTPTPTPTPLCNMSSKKHMFIYKRKIKCGWIGNGKAWKSCGERGGGGSEVSVDKTGDGAPREMNALPPLFSCLV